MGMSPSADGWFMDNPSDREEVIFTSLENLIAELEKLEKQGFTEQYLQNPAGLGAQGSPARVPVLLDHLRRFCEHRLSRLRKSR